jgi:hypothetical protein
MYEDGSVSPASYSLLEELKQLMEKITIARADKKNASKLSGPKFQLDYKKKEPHDGPR